jgi:4-hydroxy 2-oxovalerate aldolase
MNDKINIIDCSFRDGGYYNNWHFNKNLVSKYFREISKSKITHIEVGFRLPIREKINQNYGLQRFTPDYFLKKLKISKNINLGVMVNLSDMVKNNTIDKATCKSFFYEKFPKYNFVRLAVHVHEIDHLNIVVNFLKKKNIKVFINLMQISEIKKIDIKSICKKINNLKIDCLYVADSLGSLRFKDSVVISKNFRKYFKGDLGIHAHDNLKLALKNSIVFLKNKFSWVDGTIVGMGRGPGNTKTEELVKKLKYGILSRNLVKDFMFLKDKYHWGTNRYYRFSGINKIHPTYVQELLSIKRRYTKKKLFQILNFLSKNKSKKYDPLLINKIDNSKINYENFLDLAKLKKNISSKNVIIFGPNKGSYTYINKLNSTIKKKNYFTIITNSNLYINRNLVNLVCASHPRRFITDFNFHLKNNNDLVLPANNDSLSILNEIKNKNKKKKIFKFNLNLNEKIIKILPDECTLPKPLVLGYSISLAISLGFKKIYLYGFKAYKKDDIFYDESAKIFIMLKKQFKQIKIYSILNPYYSCSVKKI